MLMHSSFSNKYYTDDVPKVSLLTKHALIALSFDAWHG